MQNFLLNIRTVFTYAYKPNRTTLSHPHLNKTADIPADAEAHSARDAHAANLRAKIRTDVRYIGWRRAQYGLRAANTLRGAVGVDVTAMVEGVTDMGRAQDKKRCSKIQPSLSFVLMRGMIVTDFTHLHLGCFMYVFALLDGSFRR